MSARLFESKEVENVQEKHRNKIPGILREHY